MYVAVKGGERAIENAHALLADVRRGDRSVPAISLEQITEQLALAVDRVMSEGSLYDRALAALAIKQARGDLIEAIFLVRAFRTTCPRFGASEPLDTEEAAHWWEAHGKRSKLLVATDDSGVIGWARLFPWNQRGFDVVEDLVYVEPVHHGRGIGKALLTELIKEAKGLGYRTIVATIATDNRAGLQLHSRLGFEAVGTIRNAAHKFDRWMDITLVQRSLDD